MNPEYSEYRNVLRSFIENADPNFQPAVRVPGCQITSEEIIGQILTWTDQYLTDQSFPDLMRDHILNIVVEEAKSKYLSQNDKQKIFTPMKLVMETISLVNSICQNIYSDSKLLEKIPLPTSMSNAPPLYSVAALKNRRRVMEDRHIVVNNLNTIFGLNSLSPVSYYGIFDGHSGPDAAIYGATHLHCHLAQSSQYPNHPAEAMRDAFRKIDETFALKELNSGSTAVCALYCPDEKQLYVGWVGDSLALLATNRTIMQLVTPHKPDLPAEKERIESRGGVVMNFDGTFRVNGVLAISRAIGDFYLRPYVSSKPDIVCVPLTGDEDFLILGCDGLWDHVNEDSAALTIYNILDELVEHKDYPNVSTETLGKAAKNLALFAQDQGSTDNISIIVVYLKNPFLSTGSWPSAVISSPLDNMEAAFDNTNCSGFTTTQEILQTPNILHKMDVDDFVGEEDLGPETDVDAVDEAVHGTIPIEHVEHFDFNKKAVLINEEINEALENHVKEEILKSDILTDLTNNHHQNNHHHIDDNKLLETVAEDFGLNHKEKELDFSEKREFSFEREEYEKELHTVTDLTSEIISNDQMMLDPLIDNHVETKPDAETYIVPDPEHEPIADPTAAENVVVPESGEDSEDEWNYIKVDQKIEVSKIVDPILDNIESQEAYTADLLEQEQIDREIENVETNGISDSEQTAGNNENNGGDDDDDMSSQLNPDAKEFVPTSPVRTTPTLSTSPTTPTTPKTPKSPFTRDHKHLIMENDEIVSQSPRKYKPMVIDDLPSEGDFDIEISQRPAELGFERPGSSSSQCSYQEMNLKEAMHGDEKQEYAAETETATQKKVNNVAEVDSVVSNGNHANLHESLTKSMLEQDPMSVSFYNDGTTDSRNPFTVDLNAVHQLPDTDEDSESDKENRKNHQILAGELTPSSELASPQNDVDEISKPEEDQYSALIDRFDNKNRQSPDQCDRSDKPESEELIAHEPIMEQTESIKDKASDVTSALSDLTLSDQTGSPQFESEHFVENIKNQNGAESKYTEMGLSPIADEFHPFNVSNGGGKADLAESDICLQDTVNPVEGVTNLLGSMDNYAPKITDVDLLLMGTETMVSESAKGNDLLLERDLLMQSEHEIPTAPVTEVLNSPETDDLSPDNEISNQSPQIDIQAPIDIDFLQMSKENDILSPQQIEQPTIPQHEIVEQLFEVTTKAVDSEAPKPETVETESVVTNSIDEFKNRINEEIASNLINVEPESIKNALIDTKSEDKVAEEEIKTEEPNKNVEVAAAAGVAVAAATGAAAAAAAIVAAKDIATKPSAAPASKAKKPDPKAAKPASATVTTKKATSATSTVPSSAKSKTTTSSSAPVSAKPSAASTTAKPAPIPKARTTATATKVVDKKPAAISAATKKPLLNGDVKITASSVAPAKRISDPHKTSSVTSKTSSATGKSTTSRTGLTSKTSTTTTTTSSATSKPHTLVGRPAASTKAPTSKPTTITSTATLKPKTLVSSSTISKTSSSSARPQSSPSKPISDKSSTKETTSQKQVLSTRTTGATAAAGSIRSTISPRSITLKKSDVAKSPTAGAKTLTKTTTLTTTKKTVANGPSTLSSTNKASASTTKKPTSLATRTCLAPPAKMPQSATSPNKKGPSATKTTTTKITRVSAIDKSAVPAVAVTALAPAAAAETEEITKTIESLMIDTTIENLVGNNDLIIENNLQTNTLTSDQPLNAVIDLAAD